MAQTCPDCDGRIPIAKGELSEGRVIRKAKVRVVHKASCPQWQQRARQHGAHPDISTLIHDGEHAKITEEAES